MKFSWISASLFSLSAVSTAGLYLLVKRDNSEEKIRAYNENMKKLSEKELNKEYMKISSSDSPEYVVDNAEYGYVDSIYVFSGNTNKNTHK